MTDVEALYREHRAALLSYLIRRVEQPEDAADLLTEVFLVAMRRPDRVPEGGEAKLWLYGVARRLLANYRRGVRRRAAAVDQLAKSLATQAIGPPPTVETLAVLQQLKLLSIDDRELITLVAWDGLSPSEAARVLGLKPGTARARLSRLRRRLQDGLAAAEVLPWPATAASVTQ
jgi:RNA polymerase sigma factor (sigma-70 family)